MTDDSPRELQVRIAALESENADLRAEAATVVVPARARPSRARAVAAAVMIVLGVLLAPVAVVTGWASWTVTDTERFVATYAPLAREPAVHDYVVEQAMAAVESEVDLDALTQQLVDGLVALGTGPRATEALRALQGAAATGLRSVLRDAVTSFVESERFAAVFTQTLRVSHGQLVGTLGNDPEAALSLASDGSLGVELGPILAQARAELLDRGISVAERIPEVQRTVVLVRSDQLPRVQLAYGLTIAVGTWLPWVVLALLIGGVLVATRRARAATRAAAGVALAMVTLAVALALGRVAVLTAVPASVLPGSVSGLFYDAATDAMRSTAVAAAVLGVAVALVAWFAGPDPLPTRLRTGYGTGVGRLRDAAEGRGLSTGQVGSWVHRRRALLLAAVGLVAAAVIVLNPLSIGLVGWTAFWALLAVVAVTVVSGRVIRRRPSCAPGRPVVRRAPRPQVTNVEPCRPASWARRCRSWRSTWLPAST